MRSAWGVNRRIVRDGDQANPDVAVTSGDLEGYCEANCAQANRCAGDGPHPPEQEQCVTDCVNGHSIGYLRRDAMQSIARCLSEMACDEELRACTGPALAGSGSTSTRKSNLSLLVPEKRDEIARCFDGACQDLESCLEPVL